jgi:hypothetical protein
VLSEITAQRNGPSRAVRLQHVWALRLGLTEKLEKIAFSVNDAQDLNARKHGSIEHQVLRKMFYWLPTRLRKLRTPELSCTAYCGVTGKKRERLMGRIQEAKSEFDVFLFGVIVGLFVQIAVSFRPDYIPGHYWRSG